ncbi:MAG: hypothetical protein HRU15_14675 [Planctomycetes bacterium]|nr:hypothetical protein [Planctomycetota bacterium]
MCYIKLGICAALSMLLVGCGGGGSGAQVGEKSGGKAFTAKPADALELYVDTVRIGGTVQWAGATTLEVRLDDVPVAMTNNIWTADVDLINVTQQTVMLSLYADTVLVEMRQIIVSR